VILAAGRGVRLGALGREIPKGFITVGGATLVERSIAALTAAGIERIRIVTGHLDAQYRDLAARFESIELTHNHAFASTGSLSSLLCADPIDEPYLLVESDLLYEVRAPRLLLDAPDADLLLASGPTRSGDEVFVTARDGRLIDLNKRLDPLGGPCAGELVGLTRVSPSLHREIVACSGELLASGRPVEYETALVAAGRRHPISVLVVEDLVWTEIDDERQLARAIEVIAPRLGS
jgi:choline kinase